MGTHVLMGSKQKKKKHNDTLCVEHDMNIIAFVSVFAFHCFLMRRS